MVSGGHGLAVGFAELAPQPMCVSGSEAGGAAREPVYMQTNVAQAEVVRCRYRYRNAVFGACESYISSSIHSPSEAVSWCISQNAK